MQQPITDGKSTLPSTELQRVRGKRKWAPKSRDGCMICRARKIKCDEARPSCFRCRRLKVECRYPPSPTRNTGLRDARLIAPHPTSSSKMPSFGTSEETRYLETFRNLTTPWIGRYTYTSLFTELMPQASWSHSGLRHALVAASMASEESLCHPSQIRPHRREWHYATALQHLYQDVDLQGDVAILAAVLLWSHDMMMKKIVSAMVHMIDFLGMAIEKKRRKLALNQAADLEIEVLRGMTGWGHHQSIDTREVADQSIIAALRARVRSTRYADVAGEHSDPHREYQLFMFATGWVKERGDSTSEPDDAIYLDEMYKFSDRWYEEFSSQPNLSDFDQQNLHHHHKMSYFVLDGLKPDNFYVKDDDHETWKWIDEVMDWLESIDPEILVQAPGKKDIMMPLGSLPTQVEYRTQSPEILRRVVKILNSWDRLEGMWNSRVLAQGVYATRFEYEMAQEDAFVSKASLQKKVLVTTRKEATDGKEK